MLFNRNIICIQKDFKFIYFVYLKKINKAIWNIEPKIVKSGESGAILLLELLNEHNH
jgi:hypothetical protein